VKEEALALLDNVADPAQKLNVLREYLQVLVLRSLHESEAFTCLAFVGGTALRFAFRLPRFSEDIDFALEDPDGYRPEAWLKRLKHDLVLGGFDASVSFKDKTTVHKSWIKIAGILNEAGLAVMEDQKLSIKLEIDTRPPVGATCERALISHHRMLALRYYDLASLMAGKVHALYTRKYAKGRDWYDMLWYLGQRPPVQPNLRQLQNALDQTQGEDTVPALRWRDMLLARIEQLDCSVLQDDVRPFLERENEASLLTPNTIRSALGDTG